MRSVLLVEDDDVQLRIRAAILKAAGFEVITAPAAEEALSVIHETHNGAGTISIIITDHLLPGMTGVEFVSRVRELDKRIPIVVLSGLPDAHLEYQGQDIIFRQKPCPPDDIISLVRHSFDDAA